MFSQDKGEEISEMAATGEREKRDVKQAQYKRMRVAICQGFPKKKSVLNIPLCVCVSVSVFMVLCSNPKKQNYFFLCMTEFS